MPGLRTPTARLRGLIAALAIVSALATTGAAAAPAADVPSPVTLQEFRVDAGALEQLRSDWLAQILERNAPGTWAPMSFELDDEQLALLGLPPARVLTARSYDRPTMVSPDGTAEEVALPPAATFAGAGWFGIRPGAFLLTMDGSSITWCTLGHVYGAPGSYDISTAGHCGDVGDTATVIAAFGNRAGALNPILLDFGTFATSTNGGVGNDYAMINVRPAYQPQVTPTMAFWGGPRGEFTSNGSVVDVGFPEDLIPRVWVDPDPALMQPIVHYGHGTGIGAGGTPRAGVAMHWGQPLFMFFGAISGGDSGAGANTLLGDSVGATMEAAGIVTHIYVDPLLRKGTGVMAGTRPSVFARSPARGQLLSYPVPSPTLP
jgi:hypothetical protein